jgi:serine/threonine protein kinase
MQYDFSLVIEKLKQKYQGSPLIDRVRVQNITFKVIYINSDQCLIYRLSDLLGSGFFGKVYKCYRLSAQQQHSAEDTAYALKISRFITNDEVKFLKRNIKVYAKHRISDKEYLVTELFDIMQIKIDKQFILPLKVALKYIVDLCSQVHKMHHENKNSAPIIHGDLKINNLAITSQGNIFILDYGLSKEILDSEVEEKKNYNIILKDISTENVKKKCNPNYFAPEACNGKFCLLTDIYMLASPIAKLLGAIHPSKYKVNKYSVFYDKVNYYEYKKQKILDELDSFKKKRIKNLYDELVRKNIYTPQKLCNAYSKSITLSEQQMIEDRKKCLIRYDKLFLENAKALDTVYTEPLDFSGMQKISTQHIFANRLLEFFLKKMSANDYLQRPNIGQVLYFFTTLYQFVSDSSADKIQVYQAKLLCCFLLESHEELMNGITPQNLSDHPEVFNRICELDVIFQSGHKELKKHLSFMLSSESSKELLTTFQKLNPDPAKFSGTDIETAILHCDTFLAINKKLKKFNINEFELKKIFHPLTRQKIIAYDILITHFEENPLCYLVTLNDYIFVLNSNPYILYYLTSHALEKMSLALPELKLEPILLCWKKLSVIFSANYFSLQTLDLVSYVFDVNASWKTDYLHKKNISQLFDIMLRDGWARYFNSQTIFYVQDKINLLYDFSTAPDIKPSIYPAVYENEFRKYNSINLTIRLYRGLGMLSSYQKETLCWPRHYDETSFRKAMVSFKIWLSLSQIQESATVFFARLVYISPGFFSSKLNIDVDFVLNSIAPGKRKIQELTTHFYTSLLHFCDQNVEKIEKF